MRYLALLVFASCWRGSSPVAAIEPEESAVPGAAPWSGTCGNDDAGWGVKIDVQLLLREEEGRVIVTGKLAFADRRTKVRVTGRKADGPLLLRGTMVEIGGLHTRWQIELAIVIDDRELTGTFYEVVGGDDGPTKMCDFTWTR
jgi:hypothetical protein